MKHYFLINDNTENRISYYHLAAFLVALPYDFFYSQLILASFGIHTLLHARRNNLEMLVSKPVLLLISIYVLALIAILYSPDKAEGINILTRQLAIIIFPVLFVLTKLDLEKYRWRLLQIFGWGCAITVLYLYADAIRTIYYFKLPLSSLFTLMFMNHNFSLPIEIHATYLSVYTAFSLLIFLFLIFKVPHKKLQWVYGIAAVILFAGMMQLSSRAVFIAFLVIINFVFPFFLFKGRKRVIFLLTATCISAGSLILISSMDSFKERYIHELKNDLTGNVNII